jgi:PAS domain S-box-containing protein
LRDATAPSADRSLADHEPGAITWSWNVATGEVKWGEGIEEALFGLPAGGFERTFEAYLALVHPDDRAYFHAVIERTLAGADEYVMSHRVIWPDGSTRWIDGRGRLTRDAEGRPLLLTGIAWTQAARNAAEARLGHLRRVQAVAGAVSKELLRVTHDDDVFQRACGIAVEHGDFSFAWIGIVSADGQLRPVAHAGTDAGYLEELEGVDHPCILQRALREGKPIIVNDIAATTAEAPWREPAVARSYRACGVFPLRRSGAVIGVLVIYATETSRFDSDQNELLQGLVDDIGFKLDAIDADARRREAEEAVRHSEERYRALVEQAADAIFLAGADDVLLEVNAAACEMTGRSRKDLIGRPLAELLDPKKGDGPRVGGGSPRGTRATGERTMRRPDGTTVDVELTGTVLADGCVQSYARNITDRKLVQQQLILSDRLASLGRLAAGVAHEINNPLGYLVLGLEAAERAAGAAEPSDRVLADIRAALADARDGAGRVRAVVQALSALSRDDEGAVGHVDLHRVIDGAVRLADNNVRHRGRIVKEYAAAHGVRGNELRLGQVFVNLLVNACDALHDGTPDTNEIRVRTFDEGDRVIVEVHDNGVGIAPEIRGRIFDPFFTTKAVGQGTGLGLAISHGIVSSFGGEIGFESDPGTGTTFRVSLAVDREPPAVTAPPSVSPEGVPRFRLLIVDDEVRLARSLAALLSFHDVAIAGSAVEALALIERRPFDCILCDLMMPSLSGMDLHAELERRGHGDERRMIFMTGGAFTPRAREFVTSVPNHVLEKPFSATAVERLVAKLIADEHKTPGAPDAPGASAQRVRTQ